MAISLGSLSNVSKEPPKNVCEVLPPTKNPSENSGSSPGGNGKVSSDNSSIKDNVSSYLKVCPWKGKSTGLANSSNKKQSNIVSFNESAKNATISGISSGYSGFIGANANIFTNNVGYQLLASTSIQVPVYPNTQAISPFFKPITSAMNASDKYAQVMNQSFASTMPNVIKQAGASFATGAVVTFAFDIASGNSIGQSASHAIVTSAATTAISYTILGTVAAGSAATIAALPVVVVVGTFVLVGMGVSVAYDSNFLGIKDATEAVGQFIDDVGKAILNFFGGGK